MRIVRWSGLPAVVRVRSRGDVTVAIPSGLAREDVLDLASLVLSSGEYQELRHAIRPTGPHRSRADAHRVGHYPGPGRWGGRGGRPRRYADPAAWFRYQDWA